MGGGAATIMRVKLSLPATTAVQPARSRSPRIFWGGCAKKTGLDWLSLRITRIRMMARNAVSSITSTSELMMNSQWISSVAGRKLDCEYTSMRASGVTVDSCHATEYEKVTRSGGALPASPAMRPRDSPMSGSPPCPPPCAEEMSRRYFGSAETLATTTESPL